MKDRDSYWDSLKFILIFLVVYGHTIETYAPDGSFNRAIYNLIYTFHMPLFIFVSGRFSQIKDRDKYKKGIIRIIETFIVFHVIWQVLSWCEKGFSTISVIKFFVFPSWSLWYLLSIVWWRLIIFKIPEKVLKEKPLMILSATLLISILGGGNSC